ncbi:MAG: hypothetical protein NTV34_06330 [Proteobacteria bacterium]|nr:hypothetical protein [Pseudomonadota bacterium]
MNAFSSDLSVTVVSTALAGRRLDVVVSGSIAAVESVRFIRALRRLGAEVTPWLTEGGAQFITPMALEWASAKPCVLHFSGTASHICQSDAIIVAPASSNTINQIALGGTNTPATGLISSALGQSKPVLLLPAMHDSLANAPGHIQNLKTLATWKQVSILASRLEEGKRKFPDPTGLADQIAHILNREQRPAQPVLVTMGTTRGYIDDVRYISNYSSGKLGSVLSDELYRNGFLTHVVCGPSEFRPTNATAMIPVTTTTELLSACKSAALLGLSGGVFCASVLDYEPSESKSGKIKSNQENLQITLKPTPKIIGQIGLPGKPKIGFKLEVGLTATRAKEIAVDYQSKYKLSALIANDFSQVSSASHQAWAIAGAVDPTRCLSKQEIAHWITQHIANFSST